MTFKQYQKSHTAPLNKSTLVLLRRNDHLLLAMKKRGFGVGRWNGVGGKPEHGETIEQTAIREAQEEIKVTPLSLKQSAVLSFYFTHNPEWNQNVHIFMTDTWEGEPEETEEMKPQWYSFADIPYKSMWPDDQYWLPKILEGKKVTGGFLFNENQMIIDYYLGEG